MTYLAFGVFALFIILFSFFFMVLFAAPIIVIDLVIGFLAFGAFKRAWQMMSIIILLERDGIHYFRGTKKLTFIPWHIVEDFTFTNSRCILRVADDFFYISRELNNFEEFERQMVEQLTLPFEQRGSNLPKLSMPESLGGIRDDSPAPEKISTLLQPETELDYPDQGENIEILGEVGDDEDWIRKKLQTSDSQSLLAAHESEDPFYISNQQLLTADNPEYIPTDSMTPTYQQIGEEEVRQPAGQNMPTQEDDDDIF